jgi:hypothetical protein
MALAYAQKQSGKGASPFTSAAFTGSTVTGNMIVVAVGIDGVTGTPTVTDSKSNTYTQVVFQGGADFNGVALFYCANITGGASHTFTVTSAGNTIWAIAMEFSGQLTASPVDKFTNVHTASGTNVPVGTTAATTNANDIVIAVAVNDSGHAMTGASGFLQLTTSITAGAVGLAMAYKIVAATGTQTTSFTDSSSVDSAGIIAAFKDSGGGAGAPAVNANFFALMRP